MYKPRGAALIDIKLGLHFKFIDINWLVQTICEKIYADVFRHQLPFTLSVKLMLDL